jgi:hypothetical protein
MGKLEKTDNLASKLVGRSYQEQGFCLVHLSSLPQEGPARSIQKEHASPTI